MGYPSIYPTGTTIYNPEKCWNGYTVFQAREVGATVVDMNGNVVQVWGGLQGFPNTILPSGHVMGSTGERSLQYGFQDQIDLVQVDWDGNIVWEFEYSTDQHLSHHDIKPLPNGNILIFDNNGNSERSRVIELDPVTGRIEWTYRGESADDFYSQMCCAATRLPNGNTLATESDGGRAIEVTSDGAIVWEYLNPERAGDRGELVATLFEMTRLPADFPLDWLYDH